LELAWRRIDLAIKAKLRREEALKTTTPIPKQPRFLENALETPNVIKEVVFAKRLVIVSRVMRVWAWNRLREQANKTEALEADQLIF
jgi:hypothetical protein